MYLFTCAALISQIHKNTRRRTKINLLFIARGGRFSGGIYSTAHSLFFSHGFIHFLRQSRRRNTLLAKLYSSVCHVCPRFQVV